MVSQEYSAALLIVVQSVLAMFGYKFEVAFLNALITVILGAWIAYRRFKQGDIRITGARVDLP